MLSELELKQSNKIKEQIIAMVLHDLRSPIRFIGTISRYVVKNYRTDDPNTLFSNLNNLDRSIGSLWGFIEQFFSWAVSQQEDFHVNKSSFLLQEVLENIKDFYAEVFSFNGNLLEIKNTGIICLTDKQILSLILRNLVDNANKNTQNGTIIIEVYLTRDDAVCISVKDTGKGLSKEKIQMFMTAGNTTNSEGMGSIMILAMLKRINGTLSIERTQNVGSNFIVTLKSSQ